ncbi:ATP-binding protein [Streptomyces sp. NPDC020858]|uniref:ATP-binding protein n=1 Tax=Streptomyces sp. NPDC020858 TaxID=3365097 RepID=UPI003798DB9E
MHTAKAPPGPTEHIRQLVLRDAPDPVTRSRDFTRRVLAAWAWPPGAPWNPQRRQQVEDVLLVVCELVANACVHAGGPTQLVLRSRGERLRVEVADRDARRPEPRRADDPGRPGGYGLLIVEELAQAWGSTRGAEGKCVWLEIGAHAA